MKIAIVLRAVVAFLFVCSPFAALAAVNSSTTFVQYTLSSNPQALPVTFVFQATTDLLVLDTRAPANPVTLTINSDYTVTGGAGSTGTVTTISGGTHGVIVGDVITISRAVPLTQTTNYTNSGPLTAAMIGSSLDKLTMIAQQLNLVGARSLQFQPDETFSGVLSKKDRTNNLIGFDSNGALKWYATPGSGGVGTVTSVATSGGLTGGTITTSGTLSIADTAVTPGSYTSTNITVDQKGRITAAANGGGVSSITASTGITLTPNPIISTGTVKITDTAVTPGSYTTANITVDQQGRITAASSGLPDVQIYSSIGAFTWTKPTNAKVVFVYLVGAGSGGGSGRRGAAGTYRGGGGGGAGGSFYEAAYPAALLGATVSGYVSAGGTGGAAVTADSTNGNAGNFGGDTNFGIYARVTSPATGGGAAGTTTDGAGGTTGTQGAFLGGNGGNAGTTASPGLVGANRAAGGGGGGASLDASNSFVSAGNGGTGGYNNRGNYLEAGAGATTNSTPGTAGVSATSNEAQGGAGGGGGGGGPVGVGGAGGAGGSWGAGGGGGGASLNGNNSGVGGAGTSGIVIVITIF